VCGVTLFFASHLLIFYALGAAGVRIGVVFYLWIGIFNMVVISQFWAFANDLFTTERGKRLFPLVGIGASLGAVVGSAATALAFANVGPYRLMLVGAAGLVLPVALTLWVNRRERTTGRDAAAEHADEPLAKAGGFELIMKDRYLLLIAVLMVLLNLVNTVGEFLLARLIESEATRAVASGASGGVGLAELIGTMAGGVQASVNLLGFLFQAFLVSRIFKYIGVRGALFILPVVAFGSYSLMALLPVFGIVRFAKILENSTDYSVQNTARHALFLPTSREAKYKAKQAIDSFFVRLGDLLQAVVVFVGTLMAFGIAQFAILNLVFVTLSLVIVVAIAREYQKRTSEGAAERAA
jgi:AAA family ATP:ADP antiporter